MKATIGLLLFTVILPCLIGCAKDEPYSCFCHDQDIFFGDTYYLDTVMAASQSEAKRKCDKLDVDYYLGSVDCNGL